MSLPIPDDLRERPAEPGERCACGAAAVLVYEGDGTTSVPWCGITEPELSR